MTLFYANKICEPKYFASVYFIQTVSESIDASLYAMIDGDVTKLLPDRSLIIHSVAPPL